MLRRRHFKKQVSLDKEKDGEDRGSSDELGGKQVYLLSGNNKAKIGRK